jgi:3-methylcrotonyl-CoA carboxylase alpha subunit
MEKIMIVKRQKIDVVAIANRGEVAVRIIRACKEMGIRTVLLHSEVDVKTRAYRLADKCICIGPAASSDSYLNINANIQGALAGGAQAIHPGFGFLSENSEFSAACEKAGLIFIGPTPQSIKTLGDKVSSKELAKIIGLPLIPGYEGVDQSPEKLVNEAETMGFPVIVKAAAGGGGRGMKVIHNRQEAQELIESAQREAQAAFGSPKVFLEKFLDRAKHIEFQIFADATGHVIHLFDRECSVQRRHQKIIEEAPSPSLSPEMRNRMGDAAVKLVSYVGYRGAGTVEFLLQDHQFYFLEMNTRLQVEHPVTEMILGVDLVRAQILTAQGEAPFSSQTKMQIRGHSIECRLYAENPYMGGVPSTGLLGQIQWPEGYGRRFEFGFDEGDEITSYYDPMIAKLIVWDEDRTKAISKMLCVLEETILFGVHTNIPLLSKILSHSEFISGVMTTRFFDTHFSESLKVPQMNDEKSYFIKKVSELLSKNTESRKTEFSQSPWLSYWRNA